jgi:hypothetical protein
MDPHVKRSRIDGMVVGMADFLQAGINITVRANTLWQLRRVVGMFSEDNYGGKGGQPRSRGGAVALRVAATIALGCDCSEQWP